MAAEQDKYRDWLKSQPPEEILHHTYEYTVREDIVMALEELELTDAQAQALLESPSPCLLYTSSIPKKNRTVLTTSTPSPSGKPWRKEGSSTARWQTRKNWTMPRLSNR